MEQQCLGLAEACKVLGIKWSTGRVWLCNGRFPVKTFLMGGKRMVLVSEINRYIESIAETDDPPRRRGVSPGAGHPSGAGNSDAGEAGAINTSGVPVDQIDKKKKNGKRGPGRPTKKESMERQRALMASGGVQRG